MNEVLEPPDEPGRPAPAAGLADSRPERPSGDDVVAAFSVFYRAEIKALVNFLRWMGASVADATDIAQETMITAYKQWPSICNHRAWARRVASRTYGRRRFSRERPTDPEILSPLVRASDDIAVWEQRHDVLRMVATLPERQRQVMAWTCDGYKPQEIAKELGITSAAVRASLKLARRRLTHWHSGEGEAE